MLHSFNANGTDGAAPEAGLIFDAAGNLYGTTCRGGTYNLRCGYGCGTVFELTPTAGGGWTEQVLHSFDNNGTDGIGPRAGLIIDAAGNLYGTSQWWRHLQRRNSFRALCAWPGGVRPNAGCSQVRLAV